jgi:hypothetical protein
MLFWSENLEKCEIVNIENEFFNYKATMQTMLENYSVGLLDWMTKNPTANLKDLQVFAKFWLNDYFKGKDESR